MNNSKKSLQFNAFISGMQKLLSIIFPLITFPYITRVLQVETVGKINFVTSVISYFILIAGLGINNYAIREGASIRNDKKKIEQFSSEIFTINIISTIFAYAILLITYFFWGKLHDYTLLIIIQSFSIIGGTIGINWLYSIYEDYVYITIRTLIFQIMSLVLMFLLVKEQHDYYLYTSIVVLANVGSNIFNLIHSRKYLKLKVTKDINLKKHLKPILIIFASTIAITIYVNSDITILGWLCDDYTVGIYSVSVKVYSILKQVIASIIIVALPRMSSLFKKGEIIEYKENVNTFFNVLFTITLPSAIGIFVIADYIVRIIAGPDYLQATTSLKILSISLIFSVFSSFVTYAMILPCKNEKVQLKATIISAIENLVLNILLVPIFKENAAAFTTLIAELIVFIIEFTGFKKYDKEISQNIISVKKKNAFSCIIGCLFIALVSILINFININYILKMMLIIILSLVIYMLALIIFKNDLAIWLMNYLKKIKGKLHSFN